MTIRVVLADDQALLRAGFRVLIDAADDLEVVGEAADGDEAVAVVRETRPDVVLMDIRMPGTDGLAATEAIVADPDLADVRIIVLTTFELDEYVVAAIRAGASGFLGKGVDPVDLLDAIRVVAGGEALLSPAATKVLIGRFVEPAATADSRTPPPPARPPPSTCSPRGSARSSPSSARASPTTRSPSRSSSRPSPPRPTSTGR